MEKREQLKSMEEYAEELRRLVSLESAETFQKLWCEGKRIEAIHILRKHKILEEK